MTLQTAQPIERFHLSAANRQVREVVRLHRDGYLLLDTPYQRGDVWTPEQMIALIESFLRGVPIPAIIWNDRMTQVWTRANGETDFCYAMIDGKQRITTMVKWFGGEFGVPASWFPADEVAETEDTPDGPYVRFTGLTLIGQRRFVNYALIPVAEGKLSSVVEEARVYLLVNGAGTPQTEQDMARAARVADGD